MGGTRASWKARFRFRERLQSSWLVVPGSYVAAALLLGWGVPRIERAADEPPFGLVPNDDAAFAILQAVTGGMVAFTGLVVSVAVVVVQFGAGQYTPRLVLQFRRDPAVKHSLGIFVAPAIFAAVSLTDVGRHGDAGSGLTVLVAIALLVCAILAFFLLIARLLDLIRPRRLFERLRAAAEHAIDEVYPQPLDEHNEPPPVALGPASQTIAHRGPGGVISAVDLGGLVALAGEAGVVVELPARVGEYVWTGRPLLVTYGPVSAPVVRRLVGSVIVSEERTLTQDPAFAIRTTVDIAIRALSPAVNDPTTATQALDTIEAMLHRLAGRDLGGGHLPGPDGEIRVVYPAATWPELLDLALTEIRAYGASSHQIARRLRALLLALEGEVAESRRGAIGDQLSLLDAAVASAFPDSAERAVAMMADPAGLGGHRHRPAAAGPEVRR